MICALFCLNGLITNGRAGRQAGRVAGREDGTLNPYGRGLSLLFWMVQQCTLRPRICPCALCMQGQTFVEEQQCPFSTCACQRQTSGLVCRVVLDTRKRTCAELRFIVTHLMPGCQPSMSANQTCFDTSHGSTPPAFKASKRSPGPSNHPRLPLLLTARRPPSGRPTRWLRSA